MEQVCKYCGVIFESITKEYFCDECRFLKTECLRQKQKYEHHKREAEKRQRRLRVIEMQLEDRKKTNLKSGGRTDEEYNN